MAAHCGPALESRAACALAAVGCVAARVRSRVGRHPLDPCGHPAREEHTLPARMQRTRRESRPVRGTAAHKMQRGSRAGGQGGGRAGKLTLIICRACPNCLWTPTSCRATRSAPPLLSAWSDLRRDPNSTRLSRVRNALLISEVNRYICACGVICACRWAGALLPRPPGKGRRSGAVQGLSGSISRRGGCSGDM